MSKDYSLFFDVANQIDSTTINREIRLYYDEDGSILDITTNSVQGQHIIITQEQFDACNQKRENYTVVDENLVFTPPKQRTWSLTQEELERNPYVKS